MVRIVDRQSHEHHPAPERGRLPVAALLFGLFGAPAAWTVQLVVGYALAAEACFAEGRPLRVPRAALAWDRPVLIAVNILALAVAALATWTAYRAWRGVRGEKPGSHRELLDIGEGRTRFMAAAGLMSGFGFIAATLFNLAAAIGVPQCSG